MAKTMAEVLAEHIPERLEGYIGVRCGCGTWFLADAALTSHQQDMLTAAGFGLVADAKAEAWDQAVNEADRQWQIGHASAAILKGDNPYRTTP